MDRLLRRKRPLIVCLTIAATAAIGWRPFLLGLAAFMTVSSPLERADLILPLYHDGDSLSLAITDLHRRGLAPKVLLHRRPPGRLEARGIVPPTHEIWRRLLEARGVPPDAIDTLDTMVRGERELGTVIGAASRKGEIRRVIVVLSKPWGRLSRDAFMRGLDGAPVDVRFHAVPPRHIADPEWWQSRSGWLTYFDVYVLWLLRFVRTATASTVHAVAGGLAAVGAGL